MIERKIFECEYCNRKRLINKQQMEKHENQCWYNPKNRTCVTCKYGFYRFKPYGVQADKNINIVYESYKRKCIKNINIQFKNKTPKINCQFWEIK